MADALDPTAVDRVISETVPINPVALGKLQELAGSTEAANREASEAVIDRDLAASLQGANLLPASADLAIKLLRGELKAVRKDGRLVAVGPDGTLAADHIRAKLASAEYGPFLAADRKGSVGIRGGFQPEKPNQELSYLDKVAANLKHQREQSLGRGIPTRK